MNFFEEILVNMVDFRFISGLSSQQNTRAYQILLLWEKSFSNSFPDSVNDHNAEMLSTQWLRILTANWL